LTGSLSKVDNTSTVEHTNRERGDSYMATKKAAKGAKKATKKVAKKKKK
jgi:hypothetical protein